MNKRLTLLLASSAVALAAFADSSVSDVVARQRWPWSETVDIDFTVTGDATDVDFTATWDGQQTPVFLGTAFLASAGQHRFEWCPTNDYAGQTLTGFAVNASVAAAADHKYLVLDLENGGYSFLSAVPEGGWTLDHKSRKMVFARIPAGTYSLGYTETQLTYLNYGVTPNSYYITAYGPRTATFSSDFYIAIYKLSNAQYNVATGEAAGYDYKAKPLTYDEIRGTTNVVCWPDTKYAVAADSFAARLRAKARGALLIDLPEEEQWEAAARAGTTTFWPNGGTDSDSYATLTNYVNAIAYWKGGGQQTPSGYAVGMKAASGFGLYDIVGLGYTEWTLDSAVGVNSSSSIPKLGLQDSVDPVGAAFSGKRVVRSQSGASRNTDVSIYNMGLMYRQLVDQNYAGTSVRFTIHLKPLNFGN